MKRNCKVTKSIIVVICLTTSSCKLLSFDYWSYKVEPTYNYNFEKYEPYLTIDSTYKTANEKIKFKKMKRHFLETWLLPYVFEEGDTLKMKMYMNRGYRDYIEPDICYLNKSNGFGDYNLIKVHIENILHTQNYDTLLVLVTTSEIVPDSLMSALNIDRKQDNGKRSIARPIKVIVDSIGNWRFVCLPSTFALMANDINKEEIEELNLSLKRAIIRGSYFQKDLKPDPTFWYRIFTNPNIFFPDPDKEGFPLN